MVAMGVLLALRNVSDLFWRVGALGPLRVNLSSLLGTMAIAWAVAIIASSLGRRERDEIQGLLPAILLVGYITVWLVVGFMVHGTHPSLVREWIRLLSVIGVGLVAANLRGISAERIASVALLALVIPTVVAIGQLLTHLSVIGPQGSSDFFRAPGTFIQANKAAQSFVLAIGLSGWLLLERPRIASGLWALGSVVALVATRSLGGMAAAGAGVFSFLLLRPASRRARLALVGAAVLVAVIFAISPFGSSRIASLADTRLPWDIVGKTHNSLEWRFYNWWQLMGDWVRQPIFGHGLGSTLQLVRPIDFITHSDFVRLIVEGGVVGATLGLAFIGWAYAATARAVRRATGTRLRLASTMLAVLIGLGVQSLVQNTLSNTALLYMLAAILGCLWVQHPPRAQVTQ